MNDKWKNIGKKFIEEGETYVGTVIFIIMTILLTLQVISRYIIGKSFTWTEELACIMFVWLIYLGVSGAVTKRKHLRIDALINILPYKVKKAVLIFDDIVMFAFCIGVIPAIMTIINNFTKNHTVTSLMRLPKNVVYAIIPFGMVLTGIRLVQDIIRLAKETESTLGKSAPVIDTDALEAEYAAKKAAQEAAAAGKENK